MSLNIRTNISSITAQKNLAASSGRLQTAFERLSSGMRINRAMDDAAGLAIAESLKADARIATVAMRNANDGISIIAITDGAIGQITNDVKSWEGNVRANRRTLSETRHQLA